MGQKVLGALGCVFLTQVSGVRGVAYGHFFLRCSHFFKVGYMEGQKGGFWLHFWPFGGKIQSPPLFLVFFLCLKKHKNRGGDWVPRLPRCFLGFFQKNCKFFWRIFLFVFCGGSLWGAFGTPVHRRKMHLRCILARVSLGFLG